MADRLPQILRADARDNRERVLAAARSLFAEHGIEVTMRQVARRAGVGPATLYRRFPTKNQLIEAAFADELKACERIVHDGCADDDPWRGLRGVIERTSALNARNHGFVQAFLAAHPGSESFAQHRGRLLKQLAGLIVRAKASGGLRGDFVIDDLVLVLQAGRSLTSVPQRRRDAAARRFAALVIDALRASEVHSELPRASS